MLGSLAIYACKLAHSILFDCDLVFVVHLRASHHVTLRSCLSLELITEFLGRSVHVSAFILLLLQVDLSLTFNILHLVLQIILNLLILAELHHSMMICLNLMLARIVFNHFAPEAILLLVLHHTDIAKLDIA